MDNIFKLQDAPREISSLESGYVSQDTHYESQPQSQSQSLEDKLPPQYSSASQAIFRTGVTNKIDVSASVSQFLSEPLVKDSVQKTDSYVTKSESNTTSDSHDGKRILFHFVEKSFSTIFVLFFFHFQMIQ